LVFLGSSAHGLAARIVPPFARLTDCPSAQHSEPRQDTPAVMALLPVLGFCGGLFLKFQPVMTIYTASNGIIQLVLVDDGFFGRVNKMIPCKKL
jgi:hypothetical protein